MRTVRPSVGRVWRVLGVALATSLSPCLDASAKTFVVNSTADVIDASTGDGICDDGSGNCTLRAAIMEANAFAGTDTVSVPGGLYALSIGGSDDNAAQGDLDFRNDNLLIIGAGVDVTIVDANDIDRVFEIRTGVLGTFEGLTIRNGNAGGSVGGGLHIQNGSATLSNVKLWSNTAKKGGGIYANGVLTATDVTVSENSAPSDEGAGIRVDSNPVTLDRVTIDTNTGGDGAGILVKGGGSSLGATNVTISGNISNNRGGGMWSDHAVTLTNVTIAGNSAAVAGGGIHIAGSTVTVQNSIVANSITSNDCSAAITSLGNNIDSDGSCGFVAAGDTSGIDPLLGPLADNGGPTRTHALLTGSAAIDRGNAGGCPGVDQRGETRPSGAVCDIGAYELTEYDASGTIYEDVNGDSDLADAVTASSVLVLLYGDGGDGQPDGIDDTFVDSLRTDGSGNYTFTKIADGQTVWIAVDSKTVSPSAGFNPGSGPDSVWAEQTYGTSGALYADGAGGTAERASPGPCTAGRREGQSDAAAALSTSEHVTKVPVSGGDVTGVDFAYSFNVVTDVRDGDDDGGAERTIQGSLRQFAQNANAVAGDNPMRFAPAVATNAAGGGGSWWQVGVAGTRLPVFTDASTTLDGTAYCAWDDGTAGCLAPTQIRDPNPGDSGNPFFVGKSVGTGADGIEGSGDEPTLPTYARPELEIDGGDLGVILELAADTCLVRDAAVFDAPSSAAAILFSAGVGGLVDASYVGARADGTDPGAGSRVAYGVQLAGGAADITNNLVAYQEDISVYVQEASLVQGNEIFATRSASSADDGISVEGSGGAAITIRQNRIDATNAYAIETWETPGSFTIEDNTASRSGQGGGVEDGGIRLFGAGSTVRHNVVTGSAGAGIVLAQRGAPGSNQQNVITENAVYANGGLGIDLDVTNTGAGDNPNGDGVTANDGSTDATVPNLEFDYPVITLTALAGNSVSIEGYVGTAATKIAGTHTIELFKADNDGNNNGEVELGDLASEPHGEGRWYIDTCTTAADGTFSCVLTVPASVSLSLGDSLTATARDASGNTSEFGANAAVEALRIVKRAYRLDGTAISTSTTAPSGARLRYLLYVNNPGGAVTDLSVQDVLDPAFLFEAGTLEFDNSVDACAGLNCSGAEEDAIFAAADGGSALTDAIDGDVASFGTDTVNIGDEVVANGRLDVAAGKVWAVVFTVRMD